MHELDPESAAELGTLCEQFGSAGENLRQAVERVCENPSGQREPRHHYTKKFHSPRTYAGGDKKAKVMEFTTNHWRGLFRLVSHKKDGVTHRLVVFIPIKGRRFFPVDDCPWH